MAVDRIEGHLEWIREFEHSIQGNAKDEFESLETYCARLLRNRDEVVGADNGDDPEENLNHNQDDGERVRVQVSWTEKATYFGKKLNAVAFSVLNGNTENAELILGQMDQVVEDLKDSTSNQCKVILYCMDVLRWQIGGGVDNEGADMLNRRWEAVIANNAGKATVRFLKGMCGLTLKIEDNLVMGLYLEATELDPECLVWYHHAYRSLRRTRGKGGMQGGPLEQEVELAQRAYQLCNGEDMVSVVNYGLILKEFLWTKRHKESFWRNNYEVYVECVQVFEKAIELATIQNQTGGARGKWLMKSKLFLAEFLCFGSAPQDDKMHGREMFVELERDYPNSLAVLHKLGNLYRDDGKETKARGYYLQALDLHRTMVPCIMDYLRLLKENRRKNAFLRNRAKTEIARVLDAALSPEYVRSDRDTEKLRKEQRELENW